MQKRFTVLLITILALGCFVSTAWAEMKVAFVDVAEVFDKYEKTKEADKRLSEVGKNKQALRDSYVQDIRRMQDELVVLSNDKKAGKQEQIDKKIRELKQFDDQVRKELREERDEAIKGIIEEIDKKVTAIGKAGNYDMVINSRLLLYKNDAFDITQDVMTQLNKEYKK